MTAVEYPKGLGGAPIRILFILPGMQTDRSEQLAFLLERELDP